MRRIAPLLTLNVDNAPRNLSVYEKKSKKSCQMLCSTCTMLKYEKIYTLIDIDAK